MTTDSLIGAPAREPAGLEEPPSRPRRSWRAVPRLEVSHLLLLGALAVHAVLFLAVLPATHEDVVVRGFLYLSYHDSGWTLAGAVPYRDFLLEYPPGTLVFMVVPRLLANGFLQYRALFFGENAVLDLIVVVALWASARAVAIPAWRALLLYTVAVVLLGPTIVYRLDLAPVALTALAVWAWARGRPGFAGAALAAGVATKLYPALFVPPLLIDALARGGLRRVRRVLVAFAVMLVLWLGPLIFAVLVAGVPSVMHDITFQTNRHTQVESLWATPPLLAHLLTGYPLTVNGRARALVILGPGDALGALGTPALALVALYVYWRWWRSRGARREILLNGTACLVVAAAILSRVLSPQYLLWAMPPLALLPFRPWRHVVAVVAFGVALPLTQWIYPLHYGDLVRLLLPLPIAVLALRNLLLVVTLLALLSGLWSISRNTVHVSGGRPDPEESWQGTAPKGAGAG